MHITNLAYFYQFFDADIVRVIAAHDYFPDPVKKVTPNFSIYEHKLSERVATAEQFKVDLTRAAQSVKNDGIILNSLTHVMLLDDELSAWDFWCSLPGIIFFFFSALTLGLCVATFYLIISVRKLITAILILQAVTKQVSAEFTFDFYRRSVPNPPSDSNTTTANFFEITFRENGYYILTGLVLTFGFLCPFFLFYRFWVKAKRSSTVSFSIRTVTSHVSCIISLLTLTGVPSHYKITSPDLIANLRLSETRCKSFLAYDWISWQIMHTALGTEHKLSS